MARECCKDLLITLRACLHLAMSMYLSAWRINLPESCFLLSLLYRGGKKWSRTATALCCRTDPLHPASASLKREGPGREQSPHQRLCGSRPAPSPAQAVGRAALLDHMLQDLQAEVPDDGRLRLLCQLQPAGHTDGALLLELLAELGKHRQHVVKTQERARGGQRRGAAATPREGQHLEGGARPPQRRAGAAPPPSSTR